MTSQKFEYSYQECLACGNCPELKDNGTSVDFVCKIREEIWIPKTKLHRGCTDFKPKQEPTMTEYKFDKETPGALIGKALKYDDLKCTCYGDMRLVKESEYILICYQNNLIGAVNVMLISEWIEPETLEERAVYLYTTSAKQTCIADILLTKKDAEDRCKGYGHILHKWPISDVYKFNKQGELVE